MRFFIIYSKSNLCCRFVPLTIFLQRAVYKLCSRAKERLKIKTGMVCSFDTVVHRVNIRVEMLPRVDPVSTCSSVQHVSYTQQ